MKKLVIVSITTVLLGIITFLVAEFYVPVTYNKDELEVQIPKGCSLRRAINILMEKGVLRQLSIVFYAAKYKGIDRNLKPGIYAFHTGTTPLEVLTILIKGDTLKVPLMVVPGETLKEIATKFPNFNGTEADEFRRLAYDKAFLNSIDIKAASAEGYLYPETYIFEKGITPKEGITTMVHQLRKSYPSNFKDRLKAVGLTEHQLLTLASIVEKEAKVDTDRPLIAAVYFNRLHTGMPLQADPTSIYGVKDFKYGVSAGDLRNDTPYNTYLHTGLPPGPIASPSLKSITATLNPAKVPYLYFVSKKDGTHFFSETYSRHKEAIRIYSQQTAPKKGDK
ncbi:endolytic transglycosylase MltG [Candidatus Magnetominusculus xianensis]|uniref:Endolytic murein transglycosylase n=1 Tax=Candidatus Magnetominusculus xianensis TaxID=1748249 RepID=A0ABR5SCI3_9BACT|nr:endolytic transglycosylase MltG [Candidatus Magnetominusculus xianensis]KWT76821.1 putative aminodeoxychorismate lyase [Candidatus Magnetominusculus xianensis]MBF0402673.1 endolytic transglycosylase MltG [Nitrospirota bacterium]